MVTALKLHAEGRAARIGILDCDQHFGDGTEELIRRHRTSRWLTHVTAGQDYPRDARKFLAMLPKLVKSFKDCNVLLYQAGADPHIDDPLGGYLNDDELAQRDAIVFAETRRLGLPVVWNLAGGYQTPLRKVLDIHDRTMIECVRAYGGSGVRLHDASSRRSSARPTIDLCEEDDPGSGRITSSRRHPVQPRPSRRRSSRKRKTG